MKRITLLALLLCLCLITQAQQNKDRNTPDQQTTVTTIEDNTDTPADTLTARPGVFRRFSNALTTPGLSADAEPSGFLRWINNLAHGNIDRTFERPIDLSFAAYPYYSKDAGFQLEASANALYRLDRTDSLLQASNFMLLAGITTNLSFKFAIQGTNHWNHNQRLTYTAEFRRQHRDFWGISYNDCSTNPAIDSKALRLNIKADYQQRIGHSTWFWGAALHLAYMKMNLAAGHSNYLQFQDPKGYLIGAGPLIQHDTRDNALNATRGIYFLTKGICYPALHSANSKVIGGITMQFNAYHRLWSSAILAYDFYTCANISSGNIPWQLREEICVDDRRMRGYYAGSYTDKNQVCAQVELRQHVWKRLGAVVWGGVGTLFSHPEQIKFRSLLPTYGIGLRAEFKANTNLRIDFGLGRHTNAILFGFGEVF